MIRIRRGLEPEILTANSVAWGQEYATALEAGTNPPERYRCEEVKEALKADTFGKCAYCESYIEHIAYSNIEHILPKSIFPLLVCNWENLTLACPKCNQLKGSYSSEDAPLINPYIHDIAAAITFYGPMLIDRNAQGQLTIARLQLNRAELLFKRGERIREVVRILDLIGQARGALPVVNALLEELRNLLVDWAEYACCSRYFAYDEAPRRQVDLNDWDVL